MKIGLFCTGSNAVPPSKTNYGGTQVVSYMTAEALIERGYEVFLFAPAGSYTSGNLITIDSGWGEAVENNNVNKYYSKYIDKVDVTIDTTAFSIIGRKWKDIPYINRLGGDTNKRYCKHNDRNYVFPSYAHLKHHSQGDCSCSKRREDLGCGTPVIYKPVGFPGRPEDIPIYDKDDGYYLCLGLIQEHKGTHLAVQAAKKAGVRLRVIGPIGKPEYFREKIAPYLSDKITFEPAVGFDDKWEIFAKAKGFIFPIACSEGQPNTVMESLLTGVPVISFNREVVPEIVIDEENGVLCNDVDEMADRISEADSMRGSHCRDYVLDKFGVDAYINKYIELIDKVIDGERWI